MIKIFSKKALVILLIAVSVISILVLFFLKPISQDESYHHFADVRRIFYVANFWNVISNFPFLLVGIMSLKKLRANKFTMVTSTRIAYCIFFTGILLTAFGSAWYHNNPNNSTLLWDRLPMTVAFMSLLSISLAEFVSTRAGRIGLIPFLITGIFSIIWWQYGEQHDHGDLRLYALVQFLPMLLLSLLLLFGQHIYNKKWGYFILFVTYIFAKLTEYFDVAIYNLSGGIMAGHMLKHLLTAIGLWSFVLYLQRRNFVLL